MQLKGNVFIVSYIHVSKNAGILSFIYSIECYGTNYYDDFFSIFTSFNWMESKFPWPKNMFKNLSLYFAFISFLWHTFENLGKIVG